MSKGSKRPLLEKNHFLFPPSFSFFRRGDEALSDVLRAIRDISTWGVQPSFKDWWLHPLTV